MIEYIYILENGEISSFGRELPPNYKFEILGETDAIEKFYGWSIGINEYLSMYKCTFEDKICRSKCLLLTKRGKH